MKRCVVVVLVATLGFVIAAPAGASTPSPGHARIAKKCKKKKHGKKKKCHKSVPAPVVVPPPPPPTPLALTDAEVIQRVIQKSHEYCDVDPDCVNYGYYSADMAGTLADCSSKSTYSWTCYGWNDEDDGVDQFTCDFREVVERDGYNGITSHQDLSFGTDGWDCF